MESNPVIQPRMLKDFLYDQTLSMHRDRKSTFAVFIHAAVTSPAVLGRRISRRLSRSRSLASKERSGLPEIALGRTTSVTVKDILRWRSFRDLAEEDVGAPPPTSEFSASPSRCTTTTTATTTPSSSWCDSDFTVGDSPVWCRGFSGDVEAAGGNKNFHINAASGEKLRTTGGSARDPMDRLPHEEEQCSPVSVLDFQSTGRNFTLEHTTPQFESLYRCSVNRNGESDEATTRRVEETTAQLMNLVKETCSIEGFQGDADFLLMDFFTDGLEELENHNGPLESMLRMANAWVRGEDDGSLEWDLADTKDMCIRDMEKRGRWNDFDTGRLEVGAEVATMLFDELLDQVSMDLLYV